MADSQPQRASGEARCTLDREAGRVVLRVELERGEEIGFAIGAIRGAGLPIITAKPGVLRVLLGRRSFVEVAEALRSAGFVVRP